MSSLRVKSIASHKLKYGCVIRKRVHRFAQDSFGHSETKEQPTSILTLALSDFPIANLGFSTTVANPPTFLSLTLSKTESCKKRSRRKVSVQPQGSLLLLSHPNKNKLRQKCKRSYAQFEPYQPSSLLTANLPYTFLKYPTPSSPSPYPHHPQPPLHSPPNPFPVIASPFNLVPTFKRPRPDLPPPVPIQTPAFSPRPPINSIALPSSPTPPQPELLPSPHHNQSPPLPPEVWSRMSRAQRRNFLKHSRKQPPNSQDNN